ncbi:MAG: CBS domain-containing protein [Ketobacteraceae bacterium]|nr:CBS domain-containing protein [Ketobacteraceae bacterium]
MARPEITADIMSSQVISCKETDNLAQAHQLMKDHHIRHLPVVSGETGDFLGVITQKEVLKHAFSATAQVGLAKLAEIQSQVPVKEIMSTDVETVQPQLPLLNAGEYFIDSKHGCLPVVVDGKLQGILTSADFVKLSVTLLRSSA